MTKRREGSRRRLGRGLDSLISEPVAIPTDDPATGGDSPADRPLDLVEIPLASLRRNPQQPRQHFGATELAALAASIQSAGLMQPIVVRPVGDGGYELVAGERRWRAAAMIGMDRIPAVVRDIDDRTSAEWALIENIQRSDLNAIERAEAFRHLARDFGLTQQQIAERVGLQRGTVTNLLRLLELSEGLQTAVREGRLSMGHARALLAVGDLDRRESLAEQAMRQGWSVREMERQTTKSSPKRGGAAPLPSARSAAGHDLEVRLGTHLGTRVRLVQSGKKGSGSLHIEFYDLEQLEGLLDRLGYRGRRR